MGFIDGVKDSYFSMAESLSKNFASVKVVKVL
jgi:hypothetical protein